MKEWFRKRISTIIDLYSRHEENQIVFPKQLIFLLQMQQCLQNLSYIYGKLDYSYLTLWTIFARPQLYLPQSEYPEYIILILCILYIVNVLQLIPYSKYIGIFGQLLRCGLINFLFEISIGDAQLICHILIIIISLTETLILQGTLNVKTINFQQTQYTILDYVLLLSNYCIMITYTYGQDSVFTILLAITINFVKLIQYLKFQPALSIEKGSIFLSIQIITVYLEVVWLASLDNQFATEILLAPLVYRMASLYYQQIFSEKYQLIEGQSRCRLKDFLIIQQNITDYSHLQIEKPKDAYNKIIYGSILIAQGQFYDGYYTLHTLKSQELSLLQTFKKQIIIKHCIDKINNNLQSNYNKVSKMSIVARTFIQTETSNQQIQVKLISLLGEKIQCLRQLSNGQTQECYQNYLKCIDQLLKMQQQLVEQYDQLPCQKTQGILGFFYADVMNDFVSANELFSIAALSDEKIKRITNSQDIFSSKMVYLITQFDGQLKIERPSSDASTFLKIPNENLLNHSISDFVPPGIKEFHDQLIIDFVQYGRSKYFRQIEKNYFYSKKNNRMISMDFAIDTNLVKELSFIAFIQPGEHQIMSIILNQSLKITCMSESFIIELGLEGNTQFYIGLTIMRVLPDFPKQISQNHYVENALAYFEHNNAVYTSQNSQQNTPYNTSYNIHSKFSNNLPLYYIVQFEYFRKTANILSNSYSISQSDELKHIENDMNDESPVKKPYYNDGTQQNNTIKFSQQLYCIKIKEDDDNVSEYQGNFVSEIKQNEYTNILSRRSNDEMQMLQVGQNSSQPNNLNFCPSNVSHLVTKPKNRFTERKIQYDDDKNEQQDNSSQMTSLQAIRRSKYYKKYELLSRLNKLNSYSTNHKIFIAILILCIIFSLITQIIVLLFYQFQQLIDINNKLKHLAADIDLLQIKNYVYQPFESFLLTRWALIDYNAMLASKELSQEEFNQLVIFPRSNLRLGFEQLNENLKQVIDRVSIQNFLENTLDIYIYTSTGEGEAYNISLRNSIVILLNYQYDLKMRYAIEGFIVTDSPYVYYSYKNYLPMKSLFSQLNEYVLEETIIRAQDIENQIQSISIICLAIFSILFILQFHYFFNISRMINKYYILLQNCSSDYITDECLRLREFQEQINQDQNFLFRFIFNLEGRDENFENYNNKLVKSVRRQNSKLYIINVKDFDHYLIYLLILLLVVGNVFLTYEECSSYLSKYPDTAQFYKTVSDIGTDIPTMYSQRDVLYGRSYIAPFLKDDDWSKVLIEIKESLGRTINFIKMNINFNNYIVSSSFQQHFQTIQSENLCDFIPESLQNRSINICKVTMNGNLERGLTQLLIYIVNYIASDMEINNFTIKTTQPYQELEGAFLLSNIIDSINHYFHTDLIQQTQFYIDSINIQNIIILIMLFFTLFVILFYMKTKLVEKLYLAQRLPQLLPIKVIIFDDSFERKLRSLIQSRQSDKHL